MLYNKLSKRAYGTDSVIVIRAEDFSNNYCAIIVTIIVLQSGWQNPLKWKEEPKELPEYNA